MSDGSVVADGKLRKYRWIALGVAIVVAVIAAAYATQTYFRSDEWAYWTFRRDLLNAGDPRSLIHFFLSPHGGSSFGGAIPAGVMALWLPLDWLFGMHTYLPYAMPSILSHVGAGLLLYAVMERGVRPSVAVATAGLYLIMGNATSGVAFGWLVNFIAPVTATFAALFVLQRRPDRSRAAMVTTGAIVLVSIAFGAVGLITAIVVVGAYALRGRWRTGVWLLVLTAGVFTLWRMAYEPPGVGAEVAELGRYLGFMWNGLVTAGADLFGWPAPVGVLVPAAAVGGALWSWRVGDGFAPVTVSTAAGAVIFYATVAVRSSSLPEQSFSFDQERYLYVAAALLLPSLGWLADRVVGLQPRAVAVMGLLLAWAVVANVGHSTDSYDALVERGRANRAAIETAASLVDELGSLDAGFLVPDRTARFTVDQFRTLVEQGKVPCRVDAAAAIEFARDQGLVTDPALDPKCD